MKTGTRKVKITSPLRTRPVKNTEGRRAKKPPTPEESRMVKTSKKTFGSGVRII